ncbi:hypothetical protein HID58_001903 [Brassica napus]|uniref:Uncharacterized protein n=2 Tax=Brassica TaxID=3705 RepID=A0ABQ8EL10_BRANA|nr:hypothetical protein HID58_001903 [Brassica napus]
MAEKGKKKVFVYMGYICFVWIKKKFDLMSISIKQVTMMKLKVDLDCAKCYKKVKKVLYKFPREEIRDQWFDEKSNIVVIKVVCCSPERIMDKLCSKGGGSIKTIEIIEPPKPPPAQPSQKSKEIEKSNQTKESEKHTTSAPATAPSHAPAPKQPGPPPPVGPKQPGPTPPAVPKQPGPTPPAVPKQQGQPPPAVPRQPGPLPQPVPMMPQGQPVAMCCWPYYDGFGGGPAFYGYGMLLPQPYEYYGRPVYDSWGGGPPPGYRPCHLTRCNSFSEDNPQSCSIM